MASFPVLPEADINSPWSSAAHKAYHIMRDTYNHISQVLRQQDPDPIRLNQHTSTIINDILPILEALESDLINPMPTEWLESCAVVLGHLLVDTISAAELADEKYGFRSSLVATSINWQQR